MLELTSEQCKELEQRTIKKLREMFSVQSGSDVSLALCETVVPAVICTLQEYAQMSKEK